MKKQDIGATRLRNQRVTLATRISPSDRALVDRVVLGDTPAHKVAGDPWAETLLRRISEDVIVRDYLASFAHTEAGAHRVLGLALALARMTKRTGEVGAAALGVAGWAALSLGRWAWADALGIASLAAFEGYALGLLIRQIISERWFAELLEIESSVTEGRIRACSAVVLHRLTESRAHVHLN